LRNQGKMINVTKTFLPPFEEYTAVLKRAWDKTWITNNGELALELEGKLKAYLGLKNLLVYNNGTTVLQMALKVLNITGEVITTPFSYVATTTAILWEKCTPVFVDINPTTFCIDPLKMEAAITPKTQAILATHVYGYPCDVDAIEKIAKRYNLRVIYDAAHAFGTKIKDKTLLAFGDISTCSFHATKVFHMGEGGCIVTNNDEWARQLYLFRHFGHIGDEHFTTGINGKNSELHSALGLCNLKYVDGILKSRKVQWLYYKELFADSGVQMLEVAGDVDYNYAYFPIALRSENELTRVMRILKSHEINPRRYFYPALNTLPYVSYQSCPVAEDLANRVICLPLYYDLLKMDQERIVKIILEAIK
jgi:dTDP-4-amino-4,6-dideoxygalactose transaminase